MRASLAAAACVAALSAAPASAFDASGEVLFRVSGGGSTSAAFDAERIVGPSANMTRRETGAWTGDLAGQVVDLEVTDRRVTGVNVDLHVGQEGRKKILRGNFFGRRLSVEWDAKKFNGRVGACSFDLSRRGPGVFEGNVGCVDGATRLPRTSRASLRFAGDAASENPPMPHFALALVAVLAG